MTLRTHQVDLTDKELELIEVALHTQKKILSVQSRANGGAAQAELNILKGLLRRLRRTTLPVHLSSTPSWSQVARQFFF